MIVIGVPKHPRITLLNEACYRQNLSPPLVLDYHSLVSELTASVECRGLNPYFLSALASASTSTLDAKPSSAFALPSHVDRGESIGDQAVNWSHALAKALNKTQSPTTALKLEAPAGQDLTCLLTQLGQQVLQRLVTFIEPNTLSRLKELSNNELQTPQLLANWQSSWQCYLQAFFLPVIGCYQKEAMTGARHIKTTAIRPRQSILAGELSHQTQWFAGWLYTLFYLQHLVHDLAIKNAKVLRWVNSPDMVVWLTDKWAFSQLLTQYLPKITQNHPLQPKMPKTLGLLNTQSISVFDELQTLMSQTGESQVFIKTRYGSSGSGVMAYRRTKSAKQVLYANVVCRYQQGRYRLFNTLKPQRYAHEKDIRQIVDLLGDKDTNNGQTYTPSSVWQNVYAERWIAKPRLKTSALPSFKGEQNFRQFHFDVRMISCAGLSRQSIARVSQHPLTNLHLGNERVAVDCCLSASTIQYLRQSISHLSQHLPRCGVIGFDVICRNQSHRQEHHQADKQEHEPNNGTQSHYHIIEANAFGDWLTDVSYEGKNAYDDQVLLWS